MRTWIFPSIRSKVASKLFVCEHSMPLSSVKRQIIDFQGYIDRVGGGGGVGSEPDIRLETFKIIPDINWITNNEDPPKRFIRVLLEYSGQVVTDIAVINSQIQMNNRNALNSTSGNFIPRFFSVIIISLKKKLVGRRQMI